MFNFQGDKKIQEASGPDHTSSAAQIIDPKRLDLNDLINIKEYFSTGRNSGKQVAALQ